MLDRKKGKKRTSEILGNGGGRKGRLILLDPPPPPSDLAGVIRTLGVAFECSAAWVFLDAAKLSPAVQRAGTRLPYFVFLKINQPIQSDTIAPGPEALKLPMGGKLHHLYSAGLLFGYILELPRLLVSVRPTMLTLMRPSGAKAVKFSGTALAHQTPHISVFFSEDGAVLVCFNEQHRNLSAETLRGSAGA